MRRNSFAKRTLVVFLAAMCVLLSIPATAAGTYDRGTSLSGDISWVYNNGVLTLSRGYAAQENEITIQRNDAWKEYASS